MATATAILNEKYKSKDGTYPIIIRLIDGKKQKFHPVKYKIGKHHWMAGQVSGKHPEADIINSVIDEELLRAKRYFAECRIKSIPIDLDLVFSAVRSHSFTGYLRHRVKQHKEADQIEMQYKVERYIKELQYCFGRDLYFSEVTSDLLRQFETWLRKPDAAIKKTVNGNNTIAKKYEFLGKYYNNAIREGKAVAPNPFESYKIKTTPVKKEKLSIEQFRSLEKLPLQDGPVRFARDLFLFSYYCRGARFETCLLMRKDAVQGDRLQFQANKGLKFQSVQLHPKLRAIISHYTTTPGEYIFGRVKKDLASKKVKRSVLGSENYMVNRNLKIVAALAEIPFPLSMHHARHTLAYHLKKSSGNIGAIQDILGHSRSQVTEIYLKSLDDEYLDGVLNNLYL